MSGAVSPVTGRAYGLAAVCRVWQVPRATVYRHRTPPREEPGRRPGPVGPMPDAVLLAAIRAVLADTPFHGEGHRKVWARLRLRGVRSSRRRVATASGRTCSAVWVAPASRVPASRSTSFGISIQLRMSLGLVCTRGLSLLSSRMWTWQGVAAGGRGVERHGISLGKVSKGADR